MKILIIIGIIFFFFRYIYHAGGAGYWIARQNKKNCILSILMSLFYLVLIIVTFCNFFS